MSVVRNSLLSASVQCLAAALLVLACEPMVLRAQGPTKPQDGSISVPHVATILLARETQSTIDRTFTGTVTARRTSELGFKQIGRVEHIKVDHGAMVRQGDVLAGLDSATIQAEMVVVEAQRGAAEALLKELLAGPRKQTIDAARAEVSQAVAKRNQSKATYDRRSILINSDAISRQDIDDAKHQLAAAEADVEARKFVLDELVAGTRTERIDAQRAEIERLDATLKSLQVQLEETRIIAPFNGIVARRFVDEGAIVQPGQSILRLLETDPVEVWVGLPAEMVGRLSPGESFSFTSLEGKSETGVLTAVLPELDLATRTRTAIFELQTQQSPSDQPKPMKYGIGQIVQLNLSQSVETEGFWIPLQALSRSVKGLWSVYVVVKENVDGNERTLVRKSDVEILRIDDARVLVAGALKSGDRIVTSGVQKLTPGQAVYVAVQVEPDSASTSLSTDSEISGAAP